MPIVTVLKSTGATAVLGNRSLATLLGTNAPVGWVRGLILQSPAANTDAQGGIKIGNSAMTSTNYDALIAPSDSYTDSASEGMVMLATRYVRTEEATDQDLIIRFEST